MPISLRVTVCYHRPDDSLGSEVLDCLYLVVIIDLFLTPWKLGDQDESITPLADSQ